MSVLRLLRNVTLSLALATAVAVLPGTAGAMLPAERGASSCLTPDGGGTAAAARGGSGGDTRPVSAAEQRAIERHTRTLLRLQGVTAAKAASTVATVPVYIHKMLSTSGAGDVTDAQIKAQMAELNQDFAGGENRRDADQTGFSFVLARVDTYYNDAWHRDHSSSTYRKLTRLGGKDALNIWLVDFKYLGIATFPWDYAKSPGIDGIRVHWGSLPDGTFANYDEGKTATHEAGHWFGLFHTFQGGCTATNDEVSDTPAQKSPTTGCPIGRDSCPDLPGLDPIHNYMDYSYDACYDQFTPGQGDRMSTMWAAYRA